MVKTLGMPSPTGSHADYLRFALGFPEAWQDTPWDGDVVAKVGKKIFVFFGTGEVPSVGVVPISGTVVVDELEIPDLAP